MLAALSRMLGVRPVELDDALRSEPRARLQLTRRGLLAAGAAAATAAILPDKVWSFPAAPTFFSLQPMLDQWSPNGFDQWIPNGPLWKMPAKQSHVTLHPKVYAALRPEVR